MLSTTLGVLRNRFATNAQAEGAGKVSPVSYASFVTPEEAGPDLELFLEEVVDRRQRNDG